MKRNDSLASLYFATHLEPKPKALVYIDVNPRVLDEQMEYFRQRAGAVGRVFPLLDQNMAQSGPAV